MSFKDGWKEYKLGEIAEIIMGQSPKGETCNNENIGTPLLNGPTEFGKRYPKPIQFTTSPQRLCSKGALLFCVRGSTTGRMNWADQEYAIGRGLASIRHKTDEKLQPFIKAIIDFNLPKLLAEATGSTFPNVSGQQLKSLSVFVPSIHVQYQISKILSSLDKKIDLNNQINKTLEETAQTVFREMCLPKRNELPNGWEETGIGKLVKIQNGFAFKGSDFSKNGTSGIIKIRNINSNVVDIINTQFVSKDVTNKVDKTRFLLKGGDLLIAMTGAEVGKIGLIPKNEKELWLNQRVGCFCEKIKYANHFLFLLLSTDEYQSIIRNSSMGSAQPNISASTIEEIKAIIPTNEVIEKFGLIVNPLFERILENYAENEMLVQTRNTLLPKLMSGEIELD